MFWETGFAPKCSNLPPDNQRFLFILSRKARKNRGWSLRQFLRSTREPHFANLCRDRRSEDSAGGQGRMNRWHHNMSRQKTINVLGMTFKDKNCRNTVEKAVGGAGQKIGGCLGQGAVSRERPQNLAFFEWWMEGLWWSFVRITLYHLTISWDRPLRRNAVKSVIGGMFKNLFTDSHITPVNVD